MNQEISIYDIASRRVVKTFEVTNVDHAYLQCEDGQAWVDGTHDRDAIYIDRKRRPRTIGDGGRDDPGLRPPPPPPVISAAAVRSYTGRRITDRFSVEDQLNARGAEREAMLDWIEDVRAAGRKLRAMTPIPLDFKDDKYWPAGETNG